MNVLLSNNQLDPPKNLTPWQRVAVLGGGSFGTALAQHLARQNLAVTLWVRDVTVVTSINQEHRNHRYFPDLRLHPGLRATCALDEAVNLADVVVIAVPTTAMRQVSIQLKPYLGHKPIILGTKGIEEGSLLTMAEVVAAELGAAIIDQLLVLTGPSFAHEIMTAQPTAVVIAGKDDALTSRCSALFFAPTFRAYTSNDIMGVEMGGALKNVMAIAAGAITGLGLGQNARAAFVTRGLAEMTRFAQAKGGKPMTLLGLAGVGDLLLTCTGSYSRNRAVGEALGRGESLANVQGAIHQVAEGILTTRAAQALANQLKVRAPLTQGVYQMLFEQKPAAEIIEQLLSTQPGPEFPD